MSAPVLSAESVEVLTDLMSNVQLPVSHPKFDEVAAAWGQTKRELTALSDWHQSQ
jgi:hypothetical protein